MGLLYLVRIILVAESGRHTYYQALELVSAAVKLTIFEMFRGMTLLLARAL